MLPTRRFWREDPHILHEDHMRELGRAVQAMQISNGRIQQERGFLLSYSLGPDGRTGWWGVRYDEFRRSYTRLLSGVLDQIRPNLNAEHETKFGLIVQGLGLNETEDGREFAENVRACLWRGVSLTSVATSRRRDGSSRSATTSSRPFVA